MKYKILLSKNENTKEVEEEEKSKFIRNVLENMGLPVDEFWTNTERALTVEERIKLRKILSAYNILIIDDLDGHLQIFVENDLVAEWNKCTYVLKRDLREIDPNKRIYFEMNVHCWSVFEEDNEKE